MDIKTEIKDFSEKLLNEINNRIHIVSHFDADGITSAAILSKTFERYGVQFSTKIIKNLTKKEIDLFPKNKTIILLDLGSGSLGALEESKNKIFIIDHHEINKDIELKNVIILNPKLLNETEDLCSAELTYLVSEKISNDNKDLSAIAVLGMVGDVIEKIGRIRNDIIKKADVRIKKGLLIYPSTRPLDKSLEYNSRIFIPGVTGNSKGIAELLKEAGIEKVGKVYKSLIDLNEEEMRAITTAVMLRLPFKEASKHIGNLYTIKLFNKIEDAREVSAMINACSRMDEAETALLLCLGNSQARKKAERLYIKYKQQIISGLKCIENNENLNGREYVIINAKNKIKDTLIGTLASILSFSSIYKEGTIIITMAYNKEIIKVSARVVGRNSSRNLKEFLDSIIKILGRGESGGHKYAAGCNIFMDDEERFIELIQRYLEYEMIKV
ncbi:MAG: DHH family phosphoesterase [Nanoarchaeota archaeon]